MDSCLLPCAGAPAGFAAACLDRALDTLAARPRAALALSTRLPFCAARCLFCERDIRVAQPAEAIDDYVDGLVDEVDALARRLGGARELLQWHLGGGSANELGEAQLVRLVQAVQRHWRLPDAAELSLDCDPRRIGWLQLRTMRGLGFRRIRFGVFDLDPLVQRAIGRCHAPALIDDACAQARADGFDCIELELMVGLPQQTERRWEATLGRLVALAPDRVTLDHYRHRPGEVPAQCAIEVTSLPDAALRRRLAAQAADRLREAGYRWIGADRFVLADDALAIASAQGRLRHNLIDYTATAPTALLGVGVGAASDLDGDLFWNEGSLPRWREALRARRLPVAFAQPASGREAQRRRVREQLLCALEVPAAAMRAGLEGAYARLARYEEQGLVCVLADRILVTDAGRHALALLCGAIEGTPGRLPGPVQDPPVRAGSQRSSLA